MMKKVLLYVEFSTWNKAGEAEHGELICEERSGTMVPRESRALLQRQKQTEGVVFGEICSIDFFHLL